MLVSDQAGADGVGLCPGQETLRTERWLCLQVELGALQVSQMPSISVSRMEVPTCIDYVWRGLDWDFSASHAFSVNGRSPGPPFPVGQPRLPPEGRAVYFPCQTYPLPQTYCGDKSPTDICFPMTIWSCSFLEGQT